MREPGSGAGRSDGAEARPSLTHLAVLLLLLLLSAAHSGRFVEYGRDMDLSVAYLVMSLLGENLLRFVSLRPVRRRA